MDSTYTLRSRSNENHRTCDTKRLSASPTPPPFSDDPKKFYHSSISPEIAASVMPPGFINNPASLIATVRNYIGAPSEADHRTLEWEAESIHLPLCDDFDAYLAQHMELRQPMLHVRYPNIHSEATPIKFSIKGIRGADHYKPLAIEWMSSHPPPPKYELSRREKKQDPAKCFSRHLGALPPFRLLLALLHPGCGK